MHRGERSLGALGNLHLEAGEVIRNAFWGVVCHGNSFLMGTCLAPNNNLLRGRGAPFSARPFGEW